MYCGVSKYIVACTMLCIFLCGCAVWPNTCMVAKRKSRRRQVSSTMPADGPKQEQSVTALRGQPRQTRLELMPGSVARGHQNTPRNLAARLPWGLAPWARFPLFGYPLWGIPYGEVLIKGNRQQVAVNIFASFLRSGLVFCSFRLYLLRGSLCDPILSF